MNKVQGLHHLALTTANIKEQIEFFTGKLGMELAALYWMHGVKNTWHGCSGLIKPDTNLGGKIATKRGVQWQDYDDHLIRISSAKPPIWC